jgi:hypothetical protein
MATVYLAMDYPIESLQLGGRGGAGEAHSGTMTKLLVPEHHVAMKAFLVEFEAKLGSRGVRLTSFIHEQDRLVLLNELKALLTPPRAGAKRSVRLGELDGAIVEIVDKIVLMKAEREFRFRRRHSLFSRLIFSSLPLSQSLSPDQSMDPTRRKSNAQRRVNLPRRLSRGGRPQGRRKSTRWRSSGRCGTK